MFLAASFRPISAVLVTASLAMAWPQVAALHAQTPATPAPPPAAPAAPAPPSPVQAIRNKLSAGDLYSAESILEVHGEKYGEDAAWLAGLGWLARGALLLGDLDKAQRYAGDLRVRAAARLSRGKALAEDPELEGPLGAVIEVEAQRLERTRGRREAADYMRRELAANAGSPAFRSRLNKRLNLLTLTGSPAPELAAEAGGGGAAASLAALRGKPVVLFLWAEWCADCKAQAASLARVLRHHAADSVRCVAVTRHYDDPARHAAEAARVDSVWSANYGELPDVPRVFSSESMIRYGGSSTPTFVFVDRQGLVRRYTPTRLDEAELERSLELIVR